MRRSAKRKRVRLRARPFLWLAIVSNVLAGLFFSPLTAIRHVRVEGARPRDRARIEELLQSLSGVPALRVSAQGLESKILEAPFVSDATLSRTIFGSGLLHVEYRTAVARFDHSKRLALSDKGVIYAEDSLAGNLPILDVPQKELQPDLSLEGFWEPQRVAYIAQQARIIDAVRKERILITQPGRVILYIGQGRVVLGNCEGLEEKFQALRDRLSRNPFELSQIAELDLTLPDRPAVRQKGSHS